MKTIALYKDNAEVFINAEQIQRIAFTKKDDLRQSEREVKVQFVDGSTGVYVANRKLVKAFYSNEAFAEETVKETVEETVEE